MSDAEQQAARLTCDALCSLANGITGPASPPTPNAATPSVPTLGAHGFLYRSATEPVAVPLPPKPAPTLSSPAKTVPIRGTTNKNATAKTSTKIAKQHQLPLFLSKTYHMIDRCDPDIATWSATGDNFVVKNVEKFASAVLPLYFKHSNFSSFARQLNFYGFRKLRSDPILTNDVDPQTASYVRFYHEKFQKNKPELLHSIKRATKSDQQSKEDVDDLKMQVVKLQKCVVDMSTEMERKISEISLEYNRRISGLTAEYDKLSGLVGQLLQQQQYPHPSYIQTPHQASHLLPPLSHHAHHVPNPPLPPIVDTGKTVPNASASVSTSGNTTSSSSLSSTTTTASVVPSSAATTIPPMEQQHKMQSLSHVVAMSLMGSTSVTNAVVGPSSTASTPKGATGKRSAPEPADSSDSQSPPPAIRPKIN